MKGRTFYIVARLLMSLFRLLPYGLAGWIGEGIGRLFCRLDTRHRLIAMDNIRPSFRGEKTEAELQDIIVRLYKSFGRGLIETVCLAKMSADRIKSLTEIEGLEHYRAAHAQGKGVVLLSAHFGNWEWLGVALSVYGIAMHAVMRPMNNPYLDKLVQGWRVRFGNVVLNKRTDSGQIIKLLRKGVAMGFLLDQNVGHRQAVFVDYFGRPAATNKALATIVLRTGAPVLPTFIVKKPGGYKVIIGKALVLPKTGGLATDLLEITALFTKVIEGYVRRYPDHWLWLHRRWKTRPENEKSA